MTTLNIQARLASGVLAALALISTAAAQAPRAVDANILKTAGTAADPMAGTWLTYGLTQGETRYSSLNQIDASNVAKVGLA